ncbi:MAG: zinc ribbon domain-containing protein [Elusimicrobia bacterium]|nr:zinc ribbon domain-containing protein [Elusimicrobiota bacterium]
MKCTNCGQENKETVKVCRKCGRDLAIPPAWFPDAQWHLRTLGIIYVCLIGVYFGVSFLLRKLPRPYNIREIAPEMTPWLKRPGIPKHRSEDELKIPFSGKQAENPARAAGVPQPK